jgi:hypothetical protein
LLRFFLQKIRGEDIDRVIRLIIALAMLIDAIAKLH